MELGRVRRGCRARQLGTARVVLPAHGRSELADLGRQVGRVGGEGEGRGGGEGQGPLLAQCPAFVRRLFPPPSRLPLLSFAFPSLAIPYPSLRDGGIHSVLFSPSRTNARYVWRRAIAEQHHAFRLIVDVREWRAGLVKCCCGHV